MKLRCGSMVAKWFRLLLWEPIDPGSNPGAAGIVRIRLYSDHSPWALSPLNPSSQSGAGTRLNQLAVTIAEERREKTVGRASWTQHIFNKRERVCPLPRAMVLPGCMMGVEKSDIQ